MKKLLTASLLVIAAATLAQPAIAGEKPSQQRLEALGMANLVNGLCHAKEQTGRTMITPSRTTKVVPPTMTSDEKNQCKYVREGLTVKCFERGDCPRYEVWLRAGRHHKSKI